MVALFRRVLYELKQNRMSGSSCKSVRGAVCVLGVFLAIASFAAERRGSAANYFQEDFPFQGACIGAKFPAKNVALKGFAIRVGNGANMLWDTDLLRFAAGWTGGYITGRGVVYDGGHGQHPAIVGEQFFGTKPGPGWANAKGEFTDNRTEPFGPLAGDWCRWDGLYVNGMDVVLAYTVLGTKIYEQPSSVEADGHIGFVRTFRIESAKNNLSAVIATVENAAAGELSNGVTLTAGTNMTVTMLAGAPKGVKLSVGENSR